jgi:integrase
MTFYEASERYIADHIAGWRNGNHAAQWRATLETYAYPILGRIPVKEISTDDMLAVLEPIWRTKTETAKRLRQRIERVINAEQVSGEWEKPNPARWRGHLDKVLPLPAKLHDVKHFPALSWREVPTFVTKVRSVDGDPARAIELLIFTVARPHAVRFAQCKEFNLEARKWSIPKEHMMDNKPFDVPLSDAAIALLVVQLGKQTSPDALVFPGQRPGQPFSGTTLERLMKRIWDPNRPPGVRYRGLHGFRSAFVDWACDATIYPTAVVEAALTQRAGDAITVSYRRGSAFDLRADLMEDWARFCDGSTGPG